jgi:hypothetical protein
VLERQIQELRELNPVILRDQFKAALELDSLSAEIFKNELEKTRQELESKEEEIVRLKDSRKSSMTAVEIEKAVQEKEHLEQRVGLLSSIEEGWLERGIEDYHPVVQGIMRLFFLKALETMDRATKLKILYNALYEYIQSEESSQRLGEALKTAING